MRFFKIRGKWRNDDWNESGTVYYVFNWRVYLIPFSFFNKGLLSEGSSDIREMPLYFKFHHFMHSLN